MERKARAAVAVAATTQLDDKTSQDDFISRSDHEIQKEAPFTPTDVEFSSARCRGHLSWVWDRDKKLSTLDSQAHSNVECWRTEILNECALKRESEESPDSGQMNTNSGYSEVNVLDSECSQSFSDDEQMINVVGTAIKTEPVSPDDSVLHGKRKRDHVANVRNTTPRRQTTPGVFPLALFQNFHSSAPENETIDTDIKPSEASETDIKPNVGVTSSQILEKNCGKKPYVCRFCGEGFEKASKLTAHAQSHGSGKRPFHCSVCSSSFWKLGTLKKHVCTIVTEHRGRKRYHCDLCTSLFVTMANLKKHITQRHAGEKPYQCTLCRRCFSHELHLQLHIRRCHVWVRSLEGVAVFDTSDRTVKDVQCSKCSSSFTTKNSLRKHMLKKHATEENETESNADVDLKPAKCKKCPSAFATEILLLKHSRMHSQVQLNYKCSICPKRFATHKSLRRHIRMHEKCKDQIIKCPKCAFVFLKQPEFDKHMLNDHRENPYQCTTCKRHFASKTKLKIHARVHAVKRPFKCPDCPHTFTTRSNLKKHIQRHEKMRFTCSKCRFSFPTLDALRKHFRRHAGEICYMCPDCPSSFNSLSEVQEHSKKHTKKSPPQASQPSEHAGEMENSGGKLKMVFKRTNQNSFTCSMPSVASTSDMDVNKAVPEAEVACMNSLTTNTKAGGMDKFSSNLETFSPGGSEHLQSLTESGDSQQTLLDETSADAGYSESMEYSESNDQHEAVSTCTSPSKSGSEQFSPFSVSSACSFGTDMTRTVNMTQHNSPCTSSTPVEGWSREGEISTKDNHTHCREKTSVSNSLPASGCVASVPGLLLTMSNTTHDKLFQNVQQKTNSPSLETSEASDTSIPEGEVRTYPYLPQPPRSRASPLLQGVSSERVDGALGSQPPSNLAQSGLKKVIVVIPEVEEKLTLSLPSTTFNQQTQCSMLRQPGEKPYKCETCSAVFKYPSDLKIHTRIHTGEKPFKCSWCSRAFKSMSELSSHTKTHKDQKRFKCAECTSAFVCLSDLKIHWRIHSGEKPFQCSKCPRAFKSVSELNSHSKTHSEDKPYKCPDCTSSFRRISDLKVHVRIHSGEKPYLCSQCASAFKSVSELKSHARTHSEEKPYKCATCPSAFRSASDLKVHVRTHTGEKPYLCSKCPAAFKSGGELRSHARRTHPEGNSS